MKLFIVHVGFYEKEIGIYELHSNFFVVAEDLRQARENTKKLPIFKQKKMHIDGIQEINQVDGYDVLLKKSKKELTNESLDFSAIKKL